MKIYDVNGKLTFDSTAATERTPLRPLTTKKYTGDPADYAKHRSFEEVKNNEKYINSNVAALNNRIEDKDGEYMSLLRGQSTKEVDNLLSIFKGKPGDFSIGDKTAKPYSNDWVLGQAADFRQREFIDRTNAGVDFDTDDVYFWKARKDSVIEHKIRETIGQQKAFYANQKLLLEGRRAGIEHSGKGAWNAMNRLWLATEQNRNNIKNVGRRTFGGGSDYTTAYQQASNLLLQSSSEGTLEMLLKPVAENAYTLGLAAAGGWAGAGIGAGGAALAGAGAETSALVGNLVSMGLSATTMGSVSGVATEAAILNSGGTKEEAALGMWMVGAGEGILEVAVGGMVNKMLRGRALSSYARKPIQKVLDESAAVAAKLRERSGKVLSKHVHRALIAAQGTHAVGRKAALKEMSKDILTDALSGAAEELSQGLNELMVHSMVAPQLVPMDAEGNIDWTTISVDLAGQALAGAWLEGGFGFIGSAANMKGMVGNAKQREHSLNAAIQGLGNGETYTPDEADFALRSASVTLKAKIKEAGLDMSKEEDVQKANLMYNTEVKDILAKIQADPDGRVAFDTRGTTTTERLGPNRHVITAKDGSFASVNATTKLKGKKGEAIASLFIPADEMSPSAIPAWARKREKETGGRYVGNIRVGEKMQADTLPHEMLAHAYMEAQGAKQKLGLFRMINGFVAAGKADTAQQVAYAKAGRSSGGEVFAREVEKVTGEAPGIARGFKNIRAKMDVKRKGFMAKPENQMRVAVLDAIAGKAHTPLFGGQNTEKLAKKGYSPGIFEAVQGLEDYRVKSDGAIELDFATHELAVASGEMLTATEGIDPKISPAEYVFTKGKMADGKTDKYRILKSGDSYVLTLSPTWKQHNEALLEQVKQAEEAQAKAAEAVENQATVQDAVTEQASDEVSETGRTEAQVAQTTAIFEETDAEQEAADEEIVETMVADLTKQGKEISYRDLRAFVKKRREDKKTPKDMAQLRYPKKIFKDADEREIGKIKSMAMTVEGNIAKILAGKKTQTTRSASYKYAARKGNIVSWSNGGVTKSYVITHVKDQQLKFALAEYEAEGYASEKEMWDVFREAEITDKETGEKTPAYHDIENPKKKMRTYYFVPYSTYAGQAKAEFDAAYRSAKMAGRPGKGEISYKPQTKEQIESGEAKVKSADYMNQMAHKAKAAYIKLWPNKKAAENAGKKIRAEATDARVGYLAKEAGKVKMESILTKRRLEKEQQKENLQKTGAIFAEEGQKLNPMLEAMDSIDSPRYSREWFVDLFLNLGFPHITEAERQEDSLRKDPTATQDKMQEEGLGINLAKRADTATVISFRRSAEGMAQEAITELNRVFTGVEGRLRTDKKQIPREAFEGDTATRLTHESSDTSAIKTEDAHLMDYRRKRAEGDEATAWQLDPDRSGNIRQQVMSIAIEVVQEAGMTKVQRFEETEDILNQYAYKKAGIREGAAKIVRKTRQNIKRLERVKKGLFTNFEGIAEVTPDSDSGMAARVDAKSKAIVQKIEYVDKLLATQARKQKGAKEVMTLTETKYIAAGSMLSEITSDAGFDTQNLQLSELLDALVSQISEAAQQANDFDAAAYLAAEGVRDKGPDQLALAAERDKPKNLDLFSPTSESMAEWDLTVPSHLQYVERLMESYGVTEKDDLYPVLAKIFGKSFRLSGKEAGGIPLLRDVLNRLNIAYKNYFAGERHEAEEIFRTTVFEQTQEIPIAAKGQSAYNLPGKPEIEEIPGIREREGQLTKESFEERNKIGSPKGQGKKGNLFVPAEVALAAEVVKQLQATGTVPVSSNEAERQAREAERAEEVKLFKAVDRAQDARIEADRARANKPKDLAQLAKKRQPSTQDEAAIRLRNMSFDNRVKYFNNMSDIEILHELEGHVIDERNIAEENRAYLENQYEGEEFEGDLAQLSYSKESGRTTLLKEVKTAHEALMKHWAGLLEHNRVMSMIQSRKLQTQLSAIFNEGESKYFDPKDTKMMTYSLASMLHADAYNHGALKQVDSTRQKLQNQLNKLEGKKSRNFGE
jgi:hypothetical protein